MASKFVCLILVILSVSTFHALARTLSDASMRERHEQWIALHGRVYEDAAEKEMRFRVFKANVEYIDHSNSMGGRSYELKVNNFADQTNEEFRASRNGYKKVFSTKSPETFSSFRYENVTAVPASIDWRKKGAVTPIKDQGQRVDGTCNTRKASSHAAQITGYEDVPSNSEASLLKAVANQPVSVAIDASGSDFQFYSSGVFTGTCGTQLDHGVTAVGYGETDDGTEYRLVKNSGVAVGMRRVISVCNETLAPQKVSAALPWNPPTPLHRWLI